MRINIPGKLCEEGVHEAPDYLLRRGWSVIDVGTYVGMYSMWAARLVCNGGFVIALELNPMVYKYLYLINNSR